MPTYEIDGPDGRTYAIDGPEGATRDQVIAEIMRQQGMSPAPRKQAGVLGSFGKAAEGLYSDVKTGVKSLFGDTAQAVAEGEAEQKAIDEKYGESSTFGRVLDVGREKGVGAALGQVAKDFPDLLAQAGPSVLSSYATGKAGALGGAALAGPVGALIGGVGGAILGGAAPMFGSNLRAQKEGAEERGEEFDPNLTKAAGAALAAGAIDAVSLRGILGPKLFGRMLGKSPDEITAALSAQQKQELVKLANQGTAKAAGAGLLKAGTIEPTTEVGQQIIERAQAGQALTGDKALEAYGEAAYGGLGAAPIGGVTRALEQRGAQKQLDDRAAVERYNQNIADAAAREKAEADAIKQQEAARDAEVARQREARQLAAKLLRKDYTDGGIPYAEIALDRERLRELPQSKERDAKIAELDALAQRIVLQGQTPTTPRQAMSPFAETEPQQMELAGTVVPGDTEQQTTGSPQKLRYLQQYIGDLVAQNNPENEQKILELKRQFDAESAKADALAADQEPVVKKQQGQLALRETPYYELAVQEAEGSGLLEGNYPTADQPITRADIMAAALSVYPQGNTNFSRLLNTPAGANTIAALEGRTPAQLLADNKITGTPNNLLSMLAQTLTAGVPSTPTVVETQQPAPTPAPAPAPAPTTEPINAGNAPVSTPVSSAGPSGAQPSGRGKRKQPAVAPQPAPGVAPGVVGPAPESSPVGDGRGGFGLAPGQTNLAPAPAVSDVAPAPAPTKRGKKATQAAQPTPQVAPTPENTRGQSRFEAYKQATGKTNLEAPDEGYFTYVKAKKEELIAREGPRPEGDAGLEWDAQLEVLIGSTPPPQKAKTSTRYAAKPSSAPAPAPAPAPAAPELTREDMVQESKRAALDPDLTSAQDDIELLNSGPVSGFTRQIALAELYEIATTSKNPEAARIAQERLDQDDITQEEYVATAREVDKAIAERNTPKKQKPVAEQLKKLNTKVKIDNSGAKAVWNKLRKQAPEASLPEFDALTPSQQRDAATFLEANREDNAERKKAGLPVGPEFSMRDAQNVVKVAPRVGRAARGEAMSDGDILGAENDSSKTLPLDWQMFAGAKNALDAVKTYLSVGTDPNLLDLARTFVRARRLAEVEVQFVQDGDMLPAELVARFQKGAIAVAARGDDGTKVYFLKNKFNEEALVHEVLHAMTMAALRRNPSFATELRLIADNVADGLALQAIRTKDPSLEERARFWLRIVSTDKNAADEALAYGLTSPTFRKLLSQFAEDGKLFGALRKDTDLNNLRSGPAPDKSLLQDEPQRPNLWKRLVDAVSAVLFGTKPNQEAFTKALDAYTQNRTKYEAQAREYNTLRGLNPRLRTILSALLADSDANGLTAIGTQVTPMTAPSSLLTQESYREDKQSGWGKLMEGIATAYKFGLGTAFRTKVADNLAAVTNALSNPATSFKSPEFWTMANLYAANQANVLVHAFSFSGAVAKTPTGGYEATTIEGVSSPKEALEVIANYAKSQGISYDQARTNIGRMILAKRIEELTKANATTRSGSKLNLPMQATDPNTGRPEYEALAAEFAATPAAQEVLDKLNSVRFRLIDQMEASGILNAETAKSYRDHSFYVALDRVGQQQKATRTKAGLAVGLGRLPVLEGGTEYEVGDVIDNTVKNLGWMVGQITRNDAVKDAYKALTVQKVAMKIANPDNVPKDMTLMPPVFTGGDPEYYATKNPYIAAGFLANPLSSNAFFTFMNGAARLVRAGITTLPPFALKQMIDDSTRAAMNAGLENPFAAAAKTFANFPRELVNELLGTKSKSRQELEARGVGSGIDVDLTNPSVALERAMGIAKSDWKSVLEKLEFFGRASDMSARTAIYERTLAETGNKELAVARAREFINFRRRGASSTVAHLTNMIPFLNAGIQGTDVLYRGIAGKNPPSGLQGPAAAAQLLSRGLALASASLAYALIMGDSEEYDEATLEERAANIIVPGGYKIPLPREYGLLFKIAPELVAEAIKKSGTPDEVRAMEAIHQYFKALTGLLPVNPLKPAASIPPALRVPLEVIAEYDFYNQRKMIGMGEAGKEAGYQTTAITSEFAKYVGETFGASPIKVDYVMRSMFANTSAVVMTLVDGAVNSNRLNDPKDSGLSPAMVALKKLTIGNTFIRNPEGRADPEQFYPYADEVLSKYRTWRDMTKNMVSPAEAAKADKYYADNIDFISAYDYVQATLQNLKNVNTEIDVLQRMSDADMPREERQAAYEARLALRNSMMKDVRPVKNFIDAAARGEAPMAGVNFDNYTTSSLSSLPEVQIERVAGPRASEQFVATVRPYAEYAAAELDVPVDAILGQWGLETGWGRSVIPGTNNLGNMKDFSGGGVKATDNMTGSRDAYKQYNSLKDFTEDYVAYIRRRYPSAPSALTAKDFFAALKAGGYAEDPAYVSSGVGASRVASRLLGQ